MTLYQFKLLSEIAQWQTLWDMGIHLGERFHPEYKVLLYQIDGFYVEVFYNGRDNKIKRLISFKSIERLRPYLDQIEITKLV